LLSVIAGATGLVGCGGLESPGDEPQMQNKDVVNVSAPAVSGAELVRIHDYVARRYPQSAIRARLDHHGVAFDCVAADQQPGLAPGEIIASPPPLPNRPDSVPSTEPALCPPGSVGIERITEDDVKSFGTLRNFLQKGKSGVPGAPQLPALGGHEYTAVSAFATGVEISSELSVWNPAVAAGANEFSLSQTWVTAGSGSGTQTVEVGWQVYPQKFSGSTSTRLFVYSTSDNYATTGCYNTDCSRFVLYPGAPHVPGEVLTTSTTSLNRWIRLNTLREFTTGNWWIILSIKNTNGTWSQSYVGYYPSSLFNSAGLLNNFTRIVYGGEVAPSSNTGTHTTTDMGSGTFGALNATAAQVNMTYTPPLSDDWYYLPASATETVTNRNCYNLWYINEPTDSGVFMYFGGTGLSAACPYQTQ